jgi:choline-sulfatase
VAHPEVVTYGKTLRDRYDAEVTFVDRSLGKLLDFIAKQPWAARTAIVVTADHGEAFGEHQQYLHGFELWENLVRIPLFVHAPSLAARRIATPRSAVDLAPTILALFGLESPPQFAGKSLVDDWAAAPPPARDIVIDLPVTSDNDKRRALVHGDLKIIAFGSHPTFRMFDLAADPEEKHPIGKGEAFTEMRGRLRDASDKIEEVPPTRCRENCLNRAYLNVDAGH